MLLVLFFLFLSFSPLIQAEENVVNIQFVGSSGCYYCQKFLEEQVTKDYPILFNSGRVKIDYIPYSQCKSGTNNSLRCASDISALQACYVKELGSNGPELFAGLLVIQKARNIDFALKSCCGGIDQKKLKTCAIGQDGRNLLGKHKEEALKIAYKLGIQSWIYPLLVVDGKRDGMTEELKKDFGAVLCKKFFSENPIECSNLTK